MSDLQKLWAKQLEDPEFKEYAQEMELSSSIAKAIVAGRLRLNLSQKDLAKRTGIQQADISRLENCESLPTLKTLKRLAAGLGMKVKIDFVPVEGDDEE